MSTAMQVSATAAQLEGLHVTVGAVRVAGVFMGGFADVWQQLQATRQQLATIWQDPCHVGVLERLREVQDLQAGMLTAAQVRAISQPGTQLRLFGLLLPQQHDAYLA
jgi:hypothetical protein